MVSFLKKIFLLAICFNIINCRSNLEENTNSTLDLTSWTSIYDVNEGKVPDGSLVLFKDLVITAIDTSSIGSKAGDMYVQDPKGGLGSGIKLFQPQRADNERVTDLMPGDHVRVEGVLQYYSPTNGFNDKSHPDKKYILEIDKDGKLIHLGNSAPPAPAEVTVEDLTDARTIGGWEGVLVTLKNVTVTEELDSKYNEFVVAGNITVDSDLYLHSPKMGDCITLTGVWNFFHLYKLSPRSKDDIQPGNNCADVPKPNLVSIKDIQNEASANHPQEGTKVTIKGVITALDNTESSSKYTGFWVQEEAGGPYSGIYIYYSWTADTAEEKKPKLNEMVELTGTYSVYYGLNELGKVSWNNMGQVNKPLAPEMINDPADIATNGKLAKQYAGVLVKVENVEVASSDSHGIVLKDSTLLVENEIYNFLDPSPPAAGTKYQAIVGPLHYSYSNYKILPRGAEDMVIQETH